jgi:hypothetical protein
MPLSIERFHFHSCDVELDRKMLDAPMKLMLDSCVKLMIVPMYRYLIYLSEFAACFPELVNMHSKTQEISKQNCLYEFSLPELFGLVIRALSWTDLC